MEIILEMGSTSNINYSCKHFKGNRPCDFHKMHQIECNNCIFCEPIDTRILIVKVGSIGDVLRTTGLLKAIKEKYPSSHITWITAESVLPFFENIDLVDSVKPYDNPFTLLYLQMTKFDVSINLDADIESSMLMALADSDKKFGYEYSKAGHVFPCNPEANNWFHMGLSDILKKANKKTYQQIMLEICRLDTTVSAKPLIYKNENENQLTEKFKEQHHITEDTIVIGLNTGAGERWPLKKWTIENYIGLIRKLDDSKYNTRIILYGGPEEKERNAEIQKHVSSEIIDSGCANSIRKEIALLDAADILVTGDTLLMHVGIALNKHIILLLGPTSYYEIDLFGNGQKITSEMPCLCCYKGDCDTDINCMNSISVDTVYDHIADYLERLV
jgi:lipopolysaccharide heptosyltransferase III